MTSWIVMLKTGLKPYTHTPYGPFDDEDAARRFCEFLASEVDLAVVDRLRSPVTAVRAKGAPPADWRPEFWPPQPGHVWQDRNKNRWIGSGGKPGYLTCLSKLADDNAEHIWRHHGPMTFVHSISPVEEECPF